MYGRVAEGVSKSSLIFIIDQMKVKHHKEIEHMKERLLEEKTKVKGLEDKLGVTQRRRWETRKGSWWMIWLLNNDTDAYEYLLKTIHQTLLCGEEGSLKKGLQLGIRELKHVNISGKKFCDEDVNIYGMKLNSVTHWWRQSNPVVSELLIQKKKDLIICCDENGIKYKKSWSKTMFIGLLLNYNHDKICGEVNPMELSIMEKKLEELNKLIRNKLQE